MGAGKHSSDETVGFNFSGLKKIKDSISFVKVLIIFTILVVVVGGIFAVKMILEKYQKQPEPTEPVVAVVPSLEGYYEGYEVLGKIKIDEINIEQYILNSSDEDALEKGVIKLYGNNLNETGNFCIAGHNYENIFQKLNELEVGSDFTIIDKDLEETKYEITEIISVEPDDLRCLLSNNNKVEITLITCENISTTRLIVKAEKKLDNEKINAESDVENTVEDNDE